MASREEELQNISREIAQDALASVESMRPNVFIMGPNMDNDERPGAPLRRELVKLSWQEGVTVTAEHPAMEKAAGSLGKRFNLTTWELSIAKKAHVVILIPDSPGSFAELGMFAMRENVCPKMYVFFNKDHKEPKSYLQRGPRIAAKKRGATIHFVDYNDISRVWKKVSSYIKEAKLRMAEDNL